MARSIAERDSAVTLFFNVGRAMNTKFTKTKRERMFSKIVAKKKHIGRHHLPRDLTIMSWPTLLGVGGKS